MCLIKRSPKGVMSAQVQGCWLHSPYAPEREAERFIRSQINESAPPRGVVLLGTGLGYLHQAVRKLYPRLPCTSISYSSVLRNAGIQEGIIDPQDPPFPSDEALSAEELRKALPPCSVQDIQIVAWEPAAKAFPLLHGQVSRMIKTLLEQKQANLMTTGYFGYRWLRNFIINYLTYPEKPSSEPSSPSPRQPLLLPRKGPLIIAASGPTLNEHIPSIIHNRRLINLWALPSSLKALRTGGITPDAVITTDPGFYASAHYLELSRFSPAPPVASPLTARPISPGSSSAARPPLPYIPFTQNTAIERALLADCPAPYIPENGTVAGSALFLAEKTAPGIPVAFCGLDFGWKGLQEHCRPHPFEDLLASRSTRTHPLSSQWIARAEALGIEKDRSEQENSPGKWGSSRNLKSYRDWFSQTLNSRCRAVLLSPRSPLVSHLPAASWEDILSRPLPSFPPPGEPFPLRLPSISTRVRALSQFLSSLAPPGREASWKPGDSPEWILQWLALPAYLQWKTAEESESSSRTHQEAENLHRQVSDRIKRLLCLTQALGDMNHAIQR